MAGSLSTPRRRWWFIIVPIVLVLWSTASASGRNARYHFFAALRIARPEAVSVTVPAFSGPTGSRRLQDAIAGMLASAVHVTRTATDTTAGTLAIATRLAAFAPVLASSRADAPRFRVHTASVMTMTVSRSQLQTILAEAGERGVDVPASIDGAALTISTPASVTVEYGHCPVPEGQTLTNQIAQRPPTTVESGDCIILDQHPLVTVQAPASLDMTRLTGIALEVAGMSPIQAATFQRAIPTMAALALTMPRFARSYDSVSVQGRPALLLNTAGRRGPTYELLWADASYMYSLVGYGNSADAVTIASSLRAATAAGVKP